MMSDVSVPSYMQPMSVGIVSVPFTYCITTSSFSFSGRRFIEGQESDKSVSSCTLVNVQSSVDHGKNTSSSDVSSVGATPVMPG